MKPRERSWRASAQRGRSEPRAADIPAREFLLQTISSWRPHSESAGGFTVGPPSVAPPFPRGAAADCGVAPSELAFLKSRAQARSPEELT